MDGADAEEGKAGVVGGEEDGKGVLEAAALAPGCGCGWGVVLTSCPDLWVRKRGGCMEVEKAALRFTVLYLCHSLAIRVFVLRGYLPFFVSTGRGEVTMGYSKGHC